VNIREHAFLFGNAAVKRAAKYDACIGIH